MNRPHVTIIGSALSGNKGAAAMLESSMSALRDRLPGVRFTLLSMYPREDIRLTEHDDLEIVDASPRRLGVTINTAALVYRFLPSIRPVLRRRYSAIRALADSQVLLDQGGITFTDGREKFLLYNIASILPAINMKVPVIKCAQAVGPFRNPINRLAARMFLPKVAAIVTRGRITHEYAESLGLTNLHRGADFALSLPMKGDENDIAGQSIDLSFFDEADVTGVSPSVVLQRKVDARGADYIAEMVSFIDHLTDTGRKVLLLAHSARADTDKTHNNDLPLCREIFARLSAPESVLFLDGEFSSQVLRYLIGRCDTFVASRFHAMVSSLAMGVPTLVIGWSHKYREVLEMFGLEEWAIGNEQLESRYLESRFGQLVDDKIEVRRRLYDALPDVRTLSLSQAEVIADRVRRGLGQDRVTP